MCPSGIINAKARDTGTGAVRKRRRKLLKLQVAGLNHEGAPLALRERVALGPDLRKKAYADRFLIRRLEGLVILSTCNRTEIYLAGDVELVDVLAWWERVTGVDRLLFSDALFWLAEGDAAEHLLKVASGLDSMVLGESQILGQVKDAYQDSDRLGAVGGLHRLFQYALRTGKRVHTETEVGRNALSLGYAVVELSKKVFGSVRGRRALIIGAGETAELVGRHLSDHQLESITVANRTRERGERLAAAIGARVVSWERLEEALHQADIVVSCTGAPGLIVTRALAERAFRGEGHKFRFLFDMAVPRDIDPAIEELSRSIFLYDLDDVTRVIDANLDKRRREAVKALRIIREEVAQFQDEMGASQVGSVIRSLREKAETIRAEELDRMMNRLSHLSEEDRAAIAETTRLIMNKFLNDAMVSMRSWGKDEQKRSYVDAVRELFRLGDESREAAEGQGPAVFPSR